MDKIQVYLTHFIRKQNDSLRLNVEYSSNQTFIVCQIQNAARRKIPTQKSKLVVPILNLITSSYTYIYKLILEFNYSNHIAMKQKHSVIKTKPD